MNRVRGIYSSIEQMTNQLPKSKSSDETIQTGNQFQSILEQTRNQKVIFSKHANQRLKNRNIELSDEQMARLSNGIKSAREKDIKDSLVMVDNISFIVNIKSNTVVTAINEDEEQKIFTNIDGAVIS